MAQLSSQTLLLQAATTDCEEPLVATVAPKFDVRPLREAVLLSFVDPLPQRCLLLQGISERQWRGLLRWLDYSGLALYFFDRIVTLRLESLLPDAVRERLEKNLTDNAVRTQGMITESIAIQQQFQDARVRYASLKGFSLVPRSVPRLELRSQFDLDFLVSGESAPRARTILQNRGYRLYGANGRSWEFKRNERPGFALKDLYKDLQSWRVELHVESHDSGAASVLDRLDRCELNGFRMPVLPAVDAFVGQGLHVYKHICGEFSRAAHLVEFRRHVLSRRGDRPFWNELHAAAKDNRRIGLGLGVVTLLITQVMGEFAPEALSEWSVRHLPQDVRLWAQMYGNRAVLESFPGSKLYLLLQSAVEEAGVPAKRPVRHSLIPSRLPPPTIKAAPSEPLLTRFSRYRMQLGFILHRLRFHVVEGLRYLWELYRWRRLKSQNAC